MFSVYPTFGRLVKWGYQLVHQTGMQPLNWCEMMQLVGCLYDPGVTIRALPLEALVQY
jgi:hypothetical protein